MAVPTSKNELELAIRTNYAKLRQDVAGISVVQAKLKTMHGHSKGTFITLNNQIAYLVGWGQLVLKWIDRTDRGVAVDFPETGYKWNQLGLLALKFYGDYENEDFYTLLELLDKTVERILAVISQKSNKELYEESWYEKWTLGRMIQFNTSSPYINTRGRVRRWKKSGYTEI